MHQAFGSEIGSRSLNKRKTQTSKKKDNLNQSKIDWHFCPLLIHVISLFERIFNY